MLQLVYYSHRLISRDRPTQTGSLWLCRPFFFVAALSVHIWRVVDGDWGGTISVEENFWKELYVLLIDFLWDNGTVTEKRGGKISYLCRQNLQIYCSLDLNPFPSDLK